MEKLELKHLAPYLPYGLKCVGIDNKFQTLKLKLENSIKDYTISHLLDFDFYQIKPTLRPLSDLTRELFFTLSGKNKSTNFGVYYGFNQKEGEYLRFEGYTGRRFFKDQYKNLPYWFMEFLFENHFDIDDLILKGLAIDINTLNT